MLRMVLAQPAVIVVAAFTNHLRDGKIDFDTFMRQHQPTFVIYNTAAAV
jgi:hypothetical protein